MPFKVQVGPEQIAIHQGHTVLISEPDSTASPEPLRALGPCGSGARKQKLSGAGALESFCQCGRPPPRALENIFADAGAIDLHQFRCEMMRYSTTVAKSSQTRMGGPS